MFTHEKRESGAIETEINGDDGRTHLRFLKVSSSSTNNRQRYSSTNVQAVLRRINHCKKAEITGMEDGKNRKSSLSSKNTRRVPRSSNTSRLPAAKSRKAIDRSEPSSNCVIDIGPLLLLDGIRTLCSRSWLWNLPTLWQLSKAQQYSH